MAKILLKRGNYLDLPTSADLGEPLITLDTNQFFIGNGVGQPLSEIGSSGTQGPQGSQGSTGSQGSVGTQGNQGTQGIAGNSVQGSQGVQGSTGLGFAIAKVYGSVSELQADTNPTSIVAGQFAIIDSSDSDDGELYLWNGIIYTYVTNLEGAQGIQGPQGNQGAQGTAGISGVQGTEGVGIQGAQGTAGIPGTQGPQGAQGDSGSGILRYACATATACQVTATGLGVDIAITGSNPPVATLTVPVGVKLISASVYFLSTQIGSSATSFTVVLPTEYGVGSAYYCPMSQCFRDTGGSRATMGVHNYNVTQRTLQVTGLVTNMAYVCHISF